MEKLKRIMALIGAIALLAIMLGISIMLFNSKNLSDEVFRGLLVCLIAVPIVAYGYSLLVKWAASLKSTLPSDDELDQ